MKKITTGIFLFLFSTYTFAQQFKGQIPVEKKYRLTEIYDSSYGIIIYERLITALGADSMRNDKRGYACQGWMEDYYESGKLLHRGYYVDGQIRIFKNYYDNGQVERSFKLIDFKKSSMDVFYMDGKLKAEIEYMEGEVMKEIDYFPNGQTEFIEEMNKNLEYVVQRKSFFENGKTESTFELMDKKKKRYTKKEYYQNGKIKEEGELVYSESAFDYVKDGDWKSYNENGDLMDHDIYIAGEFNKKVK